MRDISDLRQRQALPLNAKVLMTQNRIREWYQHFNGDVFVSFSGGKDSTVLAHLVHDMYPDVPLVFCDTGLEYPEVRTFALEKMGAKKIRPTMSFSEVISKYGYPIISKENAEAIHYARKIRNGTEEKTAIRKRTELNGERTSCEHQGRIGFRRARLTGKTIAEAGDLAEKKSLFNKEKWLPLCRDTQFKISHQCCDVMKKSPFGIYKRKNKVVPYLGTLADESRLREQAWLRHGCNSFEGNKKSSQPLSFWLEQDILHYIKQEGLEIASVYGNIVSTDVDGYVYEPLPGMECNLKCTGCNRTGCVYCCFGLHLERGETRFQRLARTHPKLYEYSIGGGQWVDNPDYNPTAPKMDGDWENWNPKKIWVPSKKGLGMKKVFDDCNAIYGKDFIRYD